MNIFLVLVVAFVWRAKGSALVSNVTSVQTEELGSLFNNSSDEHLLRQEERKSTNSIVGQRIIKGRRPDNPTSPKPYVYIWDSNEDEEDQWPELGHLFFNEGFEPGKIFSNFSVPVENDVSFKPRDRHVSWEECNEPERSRLLAELEFFEKLANRLICESNGLSLEHAVAEFYMKVKAQNQEGKLTKAHLKDFEKLIKMANLRHRKNEEAIIEQLGVARRNQHFFNQQLQAVLNGIFYRSLHPHQPFVIYVRENRVSLQHSQTRTRPPSARHPRDIRKEEMFLRGCREKKIRFDSARVTQLELEVVEAENVISYFRHATSHTKLVKLKEPSAEVLKFQEQLSWTNDLFDAFSWTLEGYKTSLHYHNLYEPAHKEMERINLLMAKAGLKIQTKLSVLQYLRNFFLRELKKKDLKWDFNPTVAISETISILKKASAKLLA